MTETFEFVERQIPIYQRDHFQYVKQLEKLEFDNGGIDLKRTIRNNIHSPYTLHDMNVFSFSSVYAIPNALIGLHNVELSFCAIYRMG